MVNWHPLGTIWHPFEGAGIWPLFFSLHDFRFLSLGKNWWVAPPKPELWLAPGHRVEISNTAQGFFVGIQLVKDFDTWKISMICTLIYLNLLYYLRLIIYVHLNETKDDIVFISNGFLPLFPPCGFYLRHTKRSFRGNQKPPEVWQFALSQRAGAVLRPGVVKCPCIDPVPKTNTSQDHPN